MKEYKFNRKDDIKYKVTQIVDAYKARFPDDYIAVKDYVRIKRDNMKTQSGDMKTDFVNRPLNEYSEILADMFNQSLEEKELHFFLRDTELQRWFTRSWREFSLVEKI